MVYSEKQPVDFFAHLDELQRQLAQKDVFVFLDYDGTLTPIVDTPDMAVLSREMRETVRRLSRNHKVSIVSGRTTDDVRGKVQVDGIFYAGSHGFEIVDPEGKVEISEKAQATRHVIDEVHEKLSARLKDVQGALVENVKYTISAHYRLVSDEDFPKVEREVENILREYPGLYKTSGKKVFEIRPKIDWHKGKAVEWILNVVGYHPEEHRAIYIGDDVTDEDAFAALEGKGFGILVAEEPRESKAAYVIKNTQDVKKVLEILIRIKEERPQA
ncbi:MAG: trehalose-phosphatase [Candidatus Omnitrophica bacterium]|nr:trehalose-phosphatase [Candidatus Omnitrophota bacterium]